MPRWFFEDFTEGFTLELKGPKVGADEIVSFAKQFDPQYFHTDPEAAKKSLFGNLCASGWHTAAMTMKMMCDGYLLDSSSLGSPGIDELRWVKPVFVDDTLSMKMTVLEVKPSRSKPTMGAIKSRWDVFNQNGELVMHMTGWGLFGKRSP